MELIDMLTSGLGIKEDAAKGGTGLILNWQRISWVQAISERLPRSFRELIV